MSPATGVAPSAPKRSRAHQGTGASLMKRRLSAAVNEIVAAHERMEKEQREIVRLREQTDASLRRAFEKLDTLGANS